MGVHKVLEIASRMILGGRGSGGGGMEREQGIRTMPQLLFMSDPQRSIKYLATLCVWRLRPLVNQGYQAENVQGQEAQKSRQKWRGTVRKNHKPLSSSNSSV